MNKNFFFFLLLTPYLFSATCSVKMRDYSIDPEINTVRVEFFPNNAALVNPTLSQNFTESLKDKIVNETRLSLTDEGGDVVFSGSITGYDYSPVSLSGDQTASKSRLKITIQVDYDNFVDEKQSWSVQLTRFEDFDTNVNFSSVEDQLVESITEQLVEDIFNKAFVNW